MSTEKKFGSLEEVQEYEAGKVAGGFAGSDKYTIEEYSQVGVTWEHNIWSKDRYFVSGVQIDQKMAEKIVTMSRERVGGRPLTRDELKVLGVNV